MTPSPLMSQADVLAYLGVDKKQLVNLLKEGKIKRGAYGNFVRSEVETLGLAFASYQALAT